VQFFVRFCIAGFFLELGPYFSAIIVICNVVLLAVWVLIYMPSGVHLHPLILLALVSVFVTLCFKPIVTMVNLVFSFLCCQPS